jgi:hypothetical protein
MYSVEEEDHASLMTSSEEENHDSSMTSDEEEDHGSLMTSEEENAHWSMTTPGHARMYMTSMHKGLSRIDHIRDYLRYALVIVRDEQTPFLVWIPSARNKTEEMVHFDQYSMGNKIKLTLGSITTENCRLYYRLVFAWLRKSSSIDKLHRNVFEHPSSEMRQRTRQLNKAQRDKKTNQKRGNWKMGGGFRPNAVQSNATVAIVPLKADDDDNETPIRLALMRWNSAVRQNGDINIPNAMVMITNDMDRIVSYKLSHLVANLVTHVYNKKLTNELDTFISKVINRSDYRNVYAMVQHLISVDLRRHISKRRGIMQFSI